MKTESTFDTEPMGACPPRTQCTLSFLRDMHGQFGVEAATGAALDVIGGCLAWILEARGETALRAYLVDMVAVSNAAIEAGKQHLEGPRH